MVAGVFSVNGSKHLCVGSWNIHGARNKINMPLVEKWLCRHDVVFLCETKTNISLTVPGFNVIVGRTRSPARGGVVFLIKSYLWDKLVRVDVSEEDQIWLELSFLPGIVFGGCYIPPSDSMYYSDQSFAYMQSNARLGSAVMTLPKDDPHLIYRPVDNVKNPNASGRRLLGLCKDCDLLVVNNLFIGTRHAVNRWPHISAKAQVDFRT